VRLGIVLGLGLWAICLLVGLAGCGQQSQQEETDWLTRPHRLIQTLKQCRRGVSEITESQCQRAQKKAVAFQKQIDQALHGGTYFGVSIMRAQYQLVQIGKQLDKADSSKRFSSTKISQIRIKKHRLNELIAKKHAVVKYIFLAGKS